MSSSNIIKSRAFEKKAVGSYTPKEVTESKNSPHARKISSERLSAIEQKAYKEGLSLGEKAGRDHGIQKVMSLQETLQGLLQELNTLKQDILKSSNKEIFTIALAVARRILRKEITHDTEKIKSYIHDAAQKMGKIESMLIRLHPQDLERLSQERAEILQQIDGLQWLKLEPGPELMPGECIIESQEQIIDARVDSQLLAIYESFESFQKTSS